MSHIFWSNPRPFIRNGLIPTMRLLPGGRPIGLGGFFMGAEPSFDRLDGLSIASIIGRIQLVPAVQDAVNALKAPPQEQQRWNPRGRGAEQEDCTTVWRQAGGEAKFLPMTDDEKTVLLMTAKDPTSAELAELAKIDSWFTSHFSAQGYITSAELCAELKKPVSETETPAGMPQQGRYQRQQQQRPTQPTAIRCYLYDLATHPTKGRRGASVERHPKEVSFLSDAFFCSLEGQWRGDSLGTYNIDPNMSWGRVKQAVANAEVMEDVLSKYPWPPPIDIAPGYFWNAETQQDRVKLVQMGKPLDPGAIRVWITVNVLKNYDSMANAIEAEMKRTAKKKKRKALLKTIGLAIAGIVVAIILPVAIAAIALAIKAAVESYIAIKERQKAAKAMADAAKQFEKDAPAFAAEVQKTAEIMDEATALQAAKAPLTPEEQAAIDEDAPPPGISPFIPIGVAAAGAATAGALLL